MSVKQGIGAFVTVTDDKTGASAQATHMELAALGLALESPSPRCHCVTCRNHDRLAVANERARGR